MSMEYWWNDTDKEKKQKYSERNFSKCCFVIHKSYIRVELKLKINFQKKKSNKMPQCINIFILYLYEAQHVLGDTPPIIRSLKLHWQPLILHTWRVVGRVVVGRCRPRSSNLPRV